MCGASHRHTPGRTHPTRDSGTADTAHPSLAVTPRGISHHVASRVPRRHPAETATPRRLETHRAPRRDRGARTGVRARRETQTARSARPPRTQDRQHNQYNFSSRSTENAQSLICSLTCRISLHISLTASPTTPHVVRGARPRTRRTHSLDRSHRPLLARRGGLGAPPQAPGSVAYHILVRWPARG